MTVGKYYDMEDDPVVDALLRQTLPVGQAAMIDPIPAVKEITLRDLFALGCMMAHVNSRRDYAPANEAAPWYYKMADDMMKARNETR